MVKNIIRDEFFLSRKSVPATKADIQVVRDLLDTSNANSDHCAGLAANMIGELKTILTARISGKFEAMINPVIVDRSSQTYETEEGCLSLFGKRPTVRANIITVEYLDKNFKRRKGIFRGFEAQIIQHEMDHFNGIII